MVCRKKSLWLEHPTLKFCYLCTQLHSVMIEFLQSVSYDHSILLDFLISSETAEFVDFLRDYLHVCVQDWSDLCRACAEVESCQGNMEDSHEATGAVKSMVHSMLIYTTSQS